MTLTPVICIHCAFKFQTDIEEWIKKGDGIGYAAVTVLGRKFLNFGKSKSRTLTSIDLLCPHCRKTFEHRVES